MKDFWKIQSIQSPLREAFETIVQLRMSYGFKEIVTNKCVDDKVCQRLVFNQADSVQAVLKKAPFLRNHDFIIEL